LHKRLFSILFALLLLLSVAIPVFSHGAEEEAVDVRVLVRQAIAYVEGIADIEMAENKLNEAIEQNEEQNIADPAKLQEALIALEEERLEEANILMLEAIGGNPSVLELNPEFQIGVINIILLAIAAILLAVGLILLNKTKTKRGEMNNE